MSTIRVRHPRGYTIIPDSTLRDPRLAGARGLLALAVLARLLSRPDTWEVRPSALGRECGIGRDALRDALRLLEQHGYLRRCATRDARGRWTWVSDVYDTPQPGGRQNDGEAVAGDTGAGATVAGESGDTDSTESASTDTSSTYTPPPRGGGEIAWPTQLTDEERTACERELTRCPPEHRSAVIRELAHRLSRHDIGPVTSPNLWVRSVARAARKGTLARRAPAAPLTAEQRRVIEQDFQRRLSESRERGAKTLGLAGRAKQ